MSFQDGKTEIQDDDGEFIRRHMWFDDYYITAIVFFSDEDIKEAKKSPSRLPIIVRDELRKLEDEIICCLKKGFDIGEESCHKKKTASRKEKAMACKGYKGKRGSGKPPKVRKGKK